MEQKLTLISHIYNEEYLLPFWLEYHSQIFDHGIIIDYCSSDKSREIINKFCPTWEIIKTRNINENGTANFQAALVDSEVMDIEKTILGFKICICTTEFMVFEKETKEKIINSLVEGKRYHIYQYSVCNMLKNFYPKNAIDFFKNITHAGGELNRGYRYLHSDNFLNYSIGRHGYHDMQPEKIVNTSEIYILHTRDYPWNIEMAQRRFQIQNNIPNSDTAAGLGSHHIITYENVLISHRKHVDLLKNSLLTNTGLSNLKKMIENSINQLKNSPVKINYSELFLDSNWGEDKVLLETDVNLLKNADFDECGYKILNIENFNNFLQEFIKSEIKNITQKDVNLLNYHNEISNDEHTSILNSMPYKKKSSPELKNFSEYLEKYISNILGESIKIFNDDLWFRICRPDTVCNNDFNPCHRDVYLDFYRNIVNIYLPVVGSNTDSSLKIQPGSHKWNENETMVTKGGAFFRYTNKKYSVDAIVASKKPLEMIRPDPKIDQMMLFSPYLIHGCSDNTNEQETRISLEIRFIRNDTTGEKQEADFNEFLKVRNWR